MLALFGFVSLLALVAFHTLIAGVATRFFRLRLNTSWGAIVYTLVLTPMLLLISMLVFTGVLNVGTGINLGSPTLVVGLLVALPVVLGRRSTISTFRLRTTSNCRTRTDDGIEDGDAATASPLRSSTDYSPSNSDRTSSTRAMTASGDCEASMRTNRSGSASISRS